MGIFLPVYTAATGLTPRDIPDLVMPSVYDLHYAELALRKYPMHPRVRLVSHDATGPVRSAEVIPRFFHDREN